MNKNSLSAKLTFTALIAGLYAALTLVSAAFGSAYFGIQLRVSEVMTVMPVFSPYATVGLFIGCVLGNIASPLGIIDIAFGGIATLLSAICSRALRNVRIKKIPILSMLMPVIFNSVFVSFEINIFSQKAGLIAFLYSVLTVGIGELIVCVGLGIPFFLIVDKYKDKIIK